MTSSALTRSAPASAGTGAAAKRRRTGDIGERLVQQLDEVGGGAPTTLSDLLYCGAEWNVANAAGNKHIGAVVVLADEAAPDALVLPPMACAWAQLRLGIADEPKADIGPLFEQATAFIAEQNAKGTAVLVVSPRGLSRAPAVCVAFLVKQRPMTLRDAYAAVKAARPTIKINVGFFECLMEYEKSLRAMAEPSMTLQDFRRGLIKLWPSAASAIVPPQRRPGDTDDDDDDDDDDDVPAGVHVDLDDDDQFDNDESSSNFDEDDPYEGNVSDIDGDNVEDPEED